MQRLKHRGPDGRDVWLKDNVALGHWHFWTTPEEAEERQPLVLDGLPFTIVLDGRLDNRPELISKLNINPAEASLLSDASLILRAYAYWGEHCFEHFIGEYALVIFDQRRNQLVCARDALGDRTLFYAIHGTRTVIASEPWAAANADGSSVELNESAVAHYFALTVPEDGQTLFKSIHELLPAHVMLVNTFGERHWRYWQTDPSTLHKRGQRSDIEYAEEFRFLLEQSVHCRLRSTTPVGVLMSGGLDSPSAASLAAREIAPQPLTTISYVFDQLTDCDEREYIKTMVERWGINSIQIPCDDAWPLKDWKNWPLNPNQPEGNVYRLLKERAYKRAQDEGLRVLLSGGFGDHLYITGQDWLADLILDGRFMDVGRELRLQIQNKGLQQTLAAGYFRRAARRVLNAIPGGRHIHRKRTEAAWLTTFSIDHLLKSKSEIAPGFERYSALLGMRTAQDSSREGFNANRYTLELRDPYRDRRLVEYVLTLPAYQLYYNGSYKHILRSAMQGILPEAIRTRRQRTSLITLFMRGLEREKEVLMNCFQNPDADWRKFVRADWLLKRWNTQVTPNMDGPELMVRWLCISYASWYKSFVLSS